MILNISHDFFCIELKLSTVVTLITKFHCDISIATQWAPGPLHSKGKIRVFLLQEVLFAIDVHSVSLREYGHHTAQAQESLLNSGATNKAVFILGNSSMKVIYKSRLLRSLQRWYNKATLLYHRFLLLYHYYVEIVML